jgi:hypothetical protein
MRRVIVFILVVALAGCSGEEKRAPQERDTPEEVVRAWSRALNAGDDRRAGSLFAVGARIQQGDLVIVVREPGDAIRWTRSLPCSGTIVELDVEGETATAVFELSDRSTSACDAPGARVTAAFTVRGGKIVLFRQLGGQEPPAEPV